MSESPNDVAASAEDAAVVAGNGTRLPETAHCVNAVSARELAAFVPGFRGTPVTAWMEHPAWFWRKPGATSPTLSAHFDDIPPQSPRLCLRVSATLIEVVLPDVPAWRDYHRLYALRATLPEALLAAVIAQDGARFLEDLGAALDAEITVEGVRLEGEPAPSAYWCGRWQEAQGAQTAVFWLALPDKVRAHLARKGEIALCHPELAGRCFRAVFVLTAFALPPEVRETMAGGDALLLPEWKAFQSGLAPGQLVVEGAFTVDVRRTPEGDLALSGPVRHEVAPEPLELRLVVGGEVALPVGEVAAWCAAGEASGRVTLPQQRLVKGFFGGRLLVWGRVGKVGEADVFKIEGRAEHAGRSAETVSVSGGCAEACP